MIRIMEIPKNEFPRPRFPLSDFFNLFLSANLFYNNQTCFLSLESSSFPTIAVLHISFLLQRYLLIHLKQRTTEYLCNA